MVLSYIFTPVNGPHIGIPENAKILSAFYNNPENIVHMKVQSPSLNVTFNGIIIKEASNSDIITTATLSAILLQGETSAVQANLNSVLPHGYYTATITTTKGVSFVSPIIRVP